MKTVIIQGSSRKNGNTRQVVDYLAGQLDADIIHLTDYEISPFDYEHHYENDDFLALFRMIVDQYERIILATPVYWYSMSGLLKNFLDRITDVLQIEKETGRRLRGKYLAALSCGSDDREVRGYFVPFRETADYLGMHYLGDVHAWHDGGAVVPEVKDRLDLFLRKLSPQ